MPLRCLTVAALLWPAIAAGQLTIGPDGPVRPKPQPGESARDEPAVYRLTIAPGEKPATPLAYRFGVPAADREPGNSVPLYYRALVMWLDQPSEGRRQAEQKFSDWSDLPIDKLPCEQMRETLARFEFIVRELEQASRREFTDWDWNWESTTGGEFFRYRLTEIQESRSLARLLRAKALLEIAEGRYEDAATTIRTSYALARAVSQPPSVISGLVGLAIGSITDHTVVDWIAQPGSPNLYWAMMTLPDPLITLRPALEFELTVHERFAPWLKNVEQDRSPQIVWRDRLTATTAELDDVTDDLFGRFDFEGEWPAKLFPVLAALRSFPAAKQALRERGFDAAAIEAMPVGKVIALRQRQVDERISQELLKTAFLPTAEAIEHARAMEVTLHDYWGVHSSLVSEEPFPLLALLTPAVQQILYAESRKMVRSAGLKTVEAIRLHAAATGALPASLDEINVVPVPDDPLTGEPFSYRVDGKTAVLDVAIDPRFSQINWRFELMMAD